MKTEDKFEYIVMLLMVASTLAFVWLFLQVMV